MGEDRGRRRSTRFAAMPDYLHRVGLKVSPYSGWGLCLAVHVLVTEMYLLVSLIYYIGGGSEPTECYPHNWDQGQGMTLSLPLVS